MKTNILVVLFLVSCAVAYPGGAPEESCKDMMPSHDGAEPQESPSPYTLMAEETATQVKVTILAPKNENFNGFFLQARNSDSVPVGTFTVEDSSVAQVMTCPGGANNAVTQMSKQPQTRVAVTWTGPAEPIAFTLTVMKDKETFWVGQTVMIGQL